MVNESSRTLPMFSTFLFCPRKLYLEEVLHLGDKQVEKDLRRDIFNEALIYTNKFEEGIVKSIKSPTVFIRVLDNYKSSHSRALQEAIINHKERLAQAGVSIIDTSRKVWGDMMKATEMKAHNTFEFMTRNRLFGNELWWNLVPKMTFNLEVFAPELGVKILIDRVDNYPQGAIPVLVKRGEAPETGLWYAHRYELALCMLALAENKMIVQEGVILYNYGDEERSLMLSPELQQGVKEKLLQMTYVLSGKELPERIKNVKKCDFCPLKAKCYDDKLMFSLRNRT